MLSCRLYHCTAKLAPTVHRAINPFMFSLVFGFILKLRFVISKAVKVGGLPAMRLVKPIINFPHGKQFLVDCYYQFGGWKWLNSHSARKTRASTSNPL